MASGYDTRTTIKSAFAGRDEVIDRLLSVHPSFRDLCQDYRSCTLALERWRGQSGDEPSQRALEYAELLSELTNEIAGWLGASGNGSTPLHREDML